MNKTTVFRLLVGMCLFTLLAGGSLAGTQAWATRRTAAVAAASRALCHTTQVTLHGVLAPTFGCSDGHRGEARAQPVEGKGPQAQPWVYDEGTCAYDDDLVLYWNSNLSGAILCINGYGTLNLNQYFNGRWWNDEASSWWTGCRTVTFYVDIDQGGNQASENGSWDGESSPKGNFPLDNGYGAGTVGNDQLSSVALVDDYEGNYGGDNCY